MNQELKRLLFQAEAVAHMRGFEREILPLADYARGQAARIAELEAAMKGCTEWMEHTIEQLKTHDKGIRLNWGGPLGAAREVLTRPITPLEPENFTA